MNGIALTAQNIRERLVSSKVSFREVARRTGLSNSTVREFARSGNARVETVAKIEKAIETLSVSSSVDVQ